MFFILSASKNFILYVYMFAWTNFDTCSIFWYQMRITLQDSFQRKSESWQRRKEMRILFFFDERGWIANNDSFLQLPYWCPIFEEQCWHKVHWRPIYNAFRWKWSLTMKYSAMVIDPGDPGTWSWPWAMSNFSMTKASFEIMSLYNIALRVCSAAWSNCV